MVENFPYVAIKDLKYDIKWAQGVYRAFQKSCTHTTFFNEIFSIDEEAPPMWIAAGLNVWPGYKRSVKKHAKLLNIC